MTHLRRTTPADPDYRSLIVKLDRDLAVTDGEDHAFYDQYNKSDEIKHALVARIGNTAIGCGALKHYADGTVEIKRMYVSDGMRGRGIAGEILAELENWARELGYSRAILETGSRQRAAVRLYQKKGYARMPENYDQYAGVENSICMEKSL